MPITQSVNSKANVKRPTTNDIPFSSAQPVINSFYAVSTAGQTVFNLGFTVQTTGTFANTDSFVFFIDGKLMRLGASNDYTFTSVAADGTSSQVTMNFAVPLNLNVQGLKLGLKPEVAFGTDNRFVQMNSALGSGFQGFVDQTTLIAATSTTGTPAAGTFYSTVIGRSAMVDLSQDLKSRFGIERLMVQSIAPSQSEFGPNGEPVWITSNDTFNQIRFVGNTWAPLTGTSQGTPVFASSNTEYVEITFYGTGLNLLTQASGSVGDFRVSVDGGIESGNVWPGTGSNVLLNRNYSQNMVLQITTGLTAGIHTAKIRLNSAGVLNLAVAGFEIINSSSTNISVNPGIAYIQGQKNTSSATQLFAYNSVATGSRGGRIVVYQKGDGTLGQSWQAVNASQANLAAADHTNEEVVNQFAFREFGSGRSDDFSLIPAGSNAGAKAFTLDDGTTTLYSTSAFPIAAGTPANQPESIGINTTSDFVSLVFVGTGLDIYNTQASETGTDQIFIDGVSIGTGSAGSLWRQGWVKVVSGLPYGTHIFRYAKTSAGSGPAFPFFRTYQPKKPTIPSGAVELADYNVMATYVANASAGENIATGVLRKDAARELLYVGTWSTAINGTLAKWVFNTSTATSFVTCTFFGTGFEMRFNSGSTDNITISVDGTNPTAAGATSTSMYGPTGTFTASTGVAAITSAVQNSGISVSGLALGLHTVRMTYNSGGSIDIMSFDVITPIHSAKTNLPFDLQNTARVGSLAISDNRKLTPVKDALPVQKAWAQAIAIQSNPTTSSTSFVPMPDLSVSLKTSGGAINITYGSQVTNNGGIGIQTTAQVYVDGVAVGIPKTHDNSSSSQNIQTLVDELIVPVSAGFHKIDVYWKVSSGTSTAFSNNRDLTVKEI